MQMVHYNEEFENSRPRIFGDASMISPSYLSNITEACYTEDSLAKIQPMVSQIISLSCVPQETLKKLFSPLYLISVSP